MNDAGVTVVVAGLGAFSAFMPPLSSVGANDQKERLGLLYASAATIGIGYMIAQMSGNTFPLSLAGIVCAFEWMAYYHARRTVTPINQ